MVAIVIDFFNKRDPLDTLHIADVVLILALYYMVIIMHKILPGNRVQGYACDNESLKPLVYKLNGFLIFAAIVLAVAFLIKLGIYPVYLYKHYWGLLISANVFGLVASTLLFVRGGSEKYSRCITIDQVKGGVLVNKGLSKSVPVAPLMRFFLGSEWNPRFFGTDCKMILYAIGAVILELIILSCLAFQLQTNNQISYAMITYTALFTWFAGEYMFFENVHLYTYDLFAEKVGFKLAWGCMVFYPFFYPIGAFSLVFSPSSGDMSLEQCALTIVVFFAGWIMTRGANLQKYQYRTDPEKKMFHFVGITIQQKCIPGTRLLCSGFWKPARHLNYFGEIVQALALAIPGVLVGPTLFYRFIPLLYPLYYVLLFISRVIDDDEVCSRKYGDDWKKYCTEVPCKIFPGVW